MSHQGRGESSCRHSLAWIILGKMCFTHSDARVRREADGCPAANFSHQTQGRVWQLVLLVSCGQQSRDGSCAVSPLPGGVSPRTGAMPSGRRVAEAAPQGWPGADGAPWAAVSVLALGGRAGEWVTSGMRSLRLGGCLSPGGIMSSERNASAYE